MELQVGENRVGITFESMIWFFILTALGTVAGGLLYAYLQPWLSTKFPTIDLPKATNPTQGP